MKGECLWGSTWRRLQPHLIMDSMVLRERVRGTGRSDSSGDGGDDGVHLSEDQALPLAW